MKIEYVDQHQNVVCKEESATIPNVGDNIHWGGKQYRIVSRLYYPSLNKWDIWVSYE